MNFALILAGGSGTRVGSGVPKQFLPLYDKPLVMYSILAFQRHPQIDGIYIVSPKNHLDRLSVLKEKTYNLTKLRSIVCGGETRRHSSYLGLCEIERAAKPTDIVLIHDAARPLVSERIITENIAAAAEHGACSTALPSTDTIYTADLNGMIERIPPRQLTFAAQTPQSFRLESILKAHREVSADAEISDDAGLLVHQRLPVSIVLGEKKNLKITTAEDLEIIKQFM